jgi:Tol biopolymer transport system component
MRPRFSPDGKWIAYYDAPLGSGSRIFIISPDGGQPKQLQHDFSWARFPVWSPDGRFLLFEGLSDVGWRDWWVTPLEGAAKTAHALETLPGFSRVHAPEHWFDGKILYSAAEQGASSHLWEIGISTTDQQISGTPRQLTNGDGTEQAAGIGPRGEVLFTRMSFTQDLWSLPVDANRGIATGPLQKLTDSGANQLPWATSDGGKLVYVSNRTGLRDIWVRDSGTGQEEALTNFIQVGDRPAVSLDGSRLAYPFKDRDGRCSVLVRDLEWGSKSSILKGCFNIWSWSPDGSSLAVYTPAASVHAVDLFKLGADERRTLLSHRSLSFFDAAFAPGGGWIAFTAGASAVDSQVYVAPFRGAAIRESEWIPITSRGGGFAAWSPDGATLYFHSRRDGSPCIWSQKLNGTGRPSGDPVAVQHFHSISFGTYLMRWNDFHMSVARDRLVLNLVKENANLWFTANGR